LKKFFLNVGGGYHWNTYVTTSSTVTAGRRDENYSINANVTYVFLEHGTLAVTYQHSENSSTQAGFGYNSNQFGFQFGLQY
jgi:hypothetical protein